MFIPDGILLPRSGLNLCCSRKSIETDLGYYCIGPDSLHSCSEDSQCQSGFVCCKCATDPQKSGVCGIGNGNGISKESIGNNYCCSKVSVGPTPYSGGIEYCGSCLPFSTCTESLWC